MLHQTVYIHADSQRSAGLLESKHFGQTEVSLIARFPFCMLFIDWDYESPMNLSQLEFAAAVGEKKSFTAAARACHVTQPTLSNGIAQLEEELGGRLFVRTTRSVALTPLGNHLVPYIKEVLN